MFSFLKKRETGDDPKTLANNLYKKNIELGVKNKTLSLLGKLYQISILTLEVEVLAERITSIVRETLEFEMVGILLLNEEAKSLIPLFISRSERLEKIVTDPAHPIKSALLTNVKSIPFLKPVLSGTPNHTENIADMWGEVLPKELLASIAEESHIKTLSVYPLMIDSKTTGVLLIALNRTYDTLNEYEQQSIASLVDVTAIALDRARLYKELKEANERLKELDKAKDEFLSIATHQLKAPLSSIRGAAANMLDGSFGKVSAKMKEPIQSLFEVATGMVHLIDDYLNISRIEQGRMKYELSDFDITDIARKVADDLRVTAIKKKLELIFTGPEVLLINADIGKITQVISNLTDNAIKYTPKGKVQVIAEKFDNNGVPSARISVADSGIGIDPSEIGKLFQRFSRATDANKTNTQGTGLGLYVAKQLTEGCGGTIRIASEGLGKGSQFIVEFPIVQKETKIKNATPKT